MARDYLEGLTVDDVLRSDRKTYVKSGHKQMLLGTTHVVKVEDSEGNEHKVSMIDLRDFFIQTRGFPTILCLGEVCGEGQSGGREVSEMAKAAENKFVAKFGQEGYIRKMKDLMANR